MPLYDAFISYSHAKDKPVAAALQSVIQTLGKPWYRRRELRVFRDDTSLSATPQLWPSIENALAESRFMIVLASPDAASSVWVDKEVKWWLDNKSANTLLIGVTEGVLHWDESAKDFRRTEATPLPPSIAGLLTEPKWVDLSAHREAPDPENPEFMSCAADFAAAIRGIPKEDLLSQEVRQQRRSLTLAWSASATLMVLIALAGWQWWEANAARKAALAAEGVANEQKQVAQTQRDRAERNLGIAKTAADDVVLKLARGLRDVRGMGVEPVRRILGTAQTLMDELARTASDDPELQRSRQVMLTEFAETYLSAGDLARARAAAEESLAISRKLSASNPDNPHWQHDICVSLDKIGNVKSAEGDLAGALAAYEECRATARKLVDGNPDHADWQRDLGVALSRIGLVRVAMGDRAGALVVYRAALDILRRLAAANPGNTLWQRDLSTQLDRIGDLRSDDDDHAGALALYEESLALRRKLIASDPDNTDWQLGLSVSLHKVGRARFESGARTAALDAFRAGLAVSRKLSASDPANADWLRGVTVGLDDVADALLAGNDRKGALQAYEENLAITRKLAANDPANAQLQADLVISLVKVSSASDPARSRTALQEALALAESLARQNKLPHDRRDWPQDIRKMLAELAPRGGGARSR